jgi:hypothetical protein
MQPPRLKPCFCRDPECTKNIRAYELHGHIGYFGYEEDENCDVQGQL